MKHFATTRTLKTLLALIALLLAMALLPNLAAAEKTETFTLQAERVVSTEKGMSNKQAAAGFINNLMKGVSAKSRAAANMGYASLTGEREKKLYNALKSLITEVANGQRSTTVFDIPLKDLYEDETHITFAELGFSAASQESANAYFAQIGIDLGKTVSALLADCPYELYWFDKTVGCRTSGLNASSDASSFYLSNFQTANYTVAFSVAKEYAASNETGTTSCATNWGTAANAAAAKAREIISANASKGDVAKLTAYKEAICGLVEYNYDALAAGTAYGNPWQMVWVFDGDDSTKVVCEGYSKAFQFLCDESTFSTKTIKAIVVTGKMSVDGEGGNHMWNVVTLANGKKYLADITNSDAGSIGSAGGLFLTGYHEKSDTYGYGYPAGGTTVWYLLSDETINLFGTEVPATGDEDYTGESADPAVYTITWKNDDGTVLGTSTVAAGEKPEYKGETPTKAATAQYTYTFSGWTPEIVAATADAEYTAQYTATVREYTITWLNDDGSVIDTTTVAYGSVPTHADPAKEATAQYTYTFAGWDPAPNAVTGDATYKATYTPNLRSYTITWKNDNGTILETDENVEYGATPTYDGATPTKESTAQYTFTFKGWDPAITTVDGDKTYTATYTENIRSYTITWQNDDGSLIDTTTVEYGKMPEHAAPSKAADSEYTYTFEKWEPDLVLVTGEATYKAKFTAKPVSQESPAQPETPTQPETPSQPETPAQPETPTQPETPVLVGPATTETYSGGLFALDNDNHTATYTGPEDASASEVVIPATIPVEGSDKQYKVTKIMDGAFKNNKNLTKVTIGKNVTVIGKSTFSGCSALQTVSGGANVVTIEAGAFQKCTALTGITIGKKVTTIAKNAFSGCKKLKTITVKSKKLKTVGKKAFKNIAADAVFKCPKAKLADYETLIRKAGAPKTAKFTK